MLTRTSTPRPTMLARPEKECGPAESKRPALRSLPCRRADHPEPALAQRGSELRQADDRRRGARPKWVVELQPERDIKRQRHRRPETQSEQQRRTGRPQRRLKPAYRKG